MAESTKFEVAPDKIVSFYLQLASFLADKYTWYFDY